MSRLPVRMLTALLSLSFTPAAVSVENIEHLELERFEKALKIKPSIESGQKLYRMCVTCHGPEGWGARNGSYPQIAGQHPSVIIKQLGDICEQNRGNPIMEAFTSPRVLKSAQDVADLAGYVSNLPMTRDNGKGDAKHLAHGQMLYAKHCSKCHGEQGEGQAEDFAPKLQGQHYNYLIRQFGWIRDGHRKNADDKMVKQIEKFTAEDEAAVMSYVASLKPPKDQLAEPGWSNPDFPKYDRSWKPPAYEKPLQR